VSSAGNKSNKSCCITSVIEIKSKQWLGSDSNEFVWSPYPRLGQRQPVQFPRKLNLLLEGMIKHSSSSAWAPTLPLGRALATRTWYPDRSLTGKTVNVHVIVNDKKTTFIWEGVQQTLVLWDIWFVEVKQTKKQTNSRNCSFINLVLFTFWLRNFTVAFLLFLVATACKDIKTPTPTHLPCPWKALSWWSGWG
jgi:hypothetical protein